MFTVDQNNTILMKVIPTDTSKPFDVNSFIELFLNDGPFKYLQELVYGISVHNFINKIYSVNFSTSTRPQIIRNLVEKFQNATSVQSGCGEYLTITATFPPRPLQMVTLYPMPFAVTQAMLDNITRGWGTLERYNFGRHKRFPAFHNAYLHLYFKNPQRHNIPDTIRVNNRFVTVMVQGEEHLHRCGYCKSRDHSTPTCPNRPGTSVNKTSDSGAKKSYASLLRQSQEQVSPVYNNPLDSAESPEPSPENKNDTPQPEPSCSNAEPKTEEKNEDQSEMETDASISGNLSKQTSPSSSTDPTETKQQQAPPNPEPQIPVIDEPQQKNKEINTPQKLSPRQLSFSQPPAIQHLFEKNEEQLSEEDSEEGDSDDTLTTEPPAWTKVFPKRKHPSDSSSPHKPKHKAKKKNKLRK